MFSFQNKNEKIKHQKISNQLKMCSYGYAGDIHVIGQGIQQSPGSRCNALISQCSSGAAFRNYT